MRQFFTRTARYVSNKAGSPYAFLIALSTVVVWALLGPVLGYSSRWQLFINTGTTIVTFLMVFLIQSAQNHDQTALQLKLDELLRAVSAARTGFVNLEDLSEEQIDALRTQFSTLADTHRDEVDAPAAGPIGDDTDD